MTVEAMIPAMIRLRTTENAVAPRESELGNGTRSRTASAWPCVLAAAVNVCCSSGTTEGLAALATSNSGEGAGRDALEMGRGRIAARAAASDGYSWIR